MSALDRLIASPRRHELDHVDLAASPAEVWDAVRHQSIGHSRFVRALFALRTLPERLAGRQPDGVALHLDDMRSSPERPGFQILADAPPREVVVGAIGKVWHIEIPFAHVPDAAAFTAFYEPGWIKVAWALRVTPLGERDTRVELELRVDSTDEVAWRKFERYFRIIGRPSRFIRRSMLASLAERFGTPEDAAEHRALPGDDLLADATHQVTHGITIRAAPEHIWPWLVQMGTGRAGFYGLDSLDNAGVPSAREIRPELQHVAVGDILPVGSRGPAGLEVLRIEEPRVLVVGGLYDAAKRQLPFASARPESWQLTWAFVLEPLDPEMTRLHVRVRVVAPPHKRLLATALRPVHALVQSLQLHNVRARAEGRLPPDGWRDVVDGLRGAARIVLDFFTPRRARRHWGLDEATAERPYPGDELVARPRWGWTHAIEIAAPADEVWPWVAQIGADRAGFYSYQWLENLAGCRLRNADTIQPEWQVSQADRLVLHPKLPPLSIVDLKPGRYFVAFIGPDRDAARDKVWVAASWLFLVEPIDDDRCRFISRYRVATSGDLRTRAAFGELLIEPVGFAMDRRMLLGIKERAERVSPARAPGP